MMVLHTEYLVQSHNDAKESLSLVLDKKTRLKSGHTSGE